MKIYDFALSPNCRKVRAIVYELGLTPEFVPVRLFKNEQRRPEFVGLNPNAKVPILVDGDFVLWESNAICAYLANGTNLLPTGRRERAEVDRWNSWHTWGRPSARSRISALRSPCWGKVNPTPES
jgi:glutathione S-transferase